MGPSDVIRGLLETLDGQGGLRKSKRAKCPSVSQGVREICVHRAAYAAKKGNMISNVHRIVLLKECEKYLSSSQMRNMEQESAYQTKSLTTLK